MFASVRTLLAFGFMLACLACFAACSGGGGGGGGSRSVVASNGMVSASSGGVVGGIGNAHVDIPAGALSANTMIKISQGRSDDPLPDRAQGVGPVVVAAPDGLTFKRPATIAVPVDANMVPDGRGLKDLVVYRRQSNGSVRTTPVLGYDDKRMLVYAATSGFSSFQAAVPDGEFQIIPRTSLFAEINSSLFFQLETTRGQDMIQYEIVGAMKIDGITDADDPILEGEVAPGIRLSEQGLIMGGARELGVFGFTIRATSASVTNPASSTISLTITIVRREETGFADSSTEDLLQFDFDDHGNLYAFGRRRGIETLIKVPEDPMMPIITQSVTTGLHPHFSISPDGEAVVLVYERPQNLSLDFSIWELRRAIHDEGDGEVNDIAFDLTGNGMPDVVVDFDTDDDGPFTGSATELNRFVRELNEDFRELQLGVTAVANHTFEGISIQDNDTLFLNSMPTGLGPRMLFGGDSYGSLPDINSQNHTLNTRIMAQEFNRDLQQIGPAHRIDQDIIYDPAQDPTLSAFARQATNPVAAFAQDRGIEPELDEEGNPLPIRRVYAVVYEQIRHLDVAGALRSDIYMVWREFGGFTLSNETRLDTTDIAGESAGDPIAVTGLESGVTIAWTERGGDNGGTNGVDSLGDPIYGSPGDVQLLVIAKPVLPPLPGPEDDPEDVEPLEIPYAVTVPAATAVNPEATSTGRHPALKTSAANAVYIAWSERDDSLAPLGESPMTQYSNLGSQTSGIVERRELALRVAPVSGSSVGTSFLVKDAPLESSIYSASLAVSADGVIAVAWVEAFFNGQQGTFLRRFRPSGAPIENSVEISIGAAPLIGFDLQDRLNIGFLAGGTVTTFSFEEEMPEPPPPEEN